MPSRSAWRRRAPHRGGRAGRAQATDLPAGQAGRRALERWLAEPTAEPTEIRDLGLLKLFFGSLTGSPERRALAEEQRRAHHRRREEYEALREAVSAVATPHQLATLEMGLRFERASAAFWTELLDDESF